MPTERIQHLKGGKVQWEPHLGKWVAMSYASRLGGFESKEQALQAVNNHTAELDAFLLRSCITCGRELPPADHRRRCPKCIKEGYTLD